jgi:hypothetical protein
MANTPSPVVSVCRIAVVLPGNARLTFAPGTAAPEGSMIEPITRPLICALSGVTATQAPIKVINASIRARRSLYRTPDPFPEKELLGRKCKQEYHAFIGTFWPLPQCEALQFQNFLQFPELPAACDRTFISRVLRVYS